MPRPRASVFAVLNNQRRSTYRRKKSRRAFSRFNTYKNRSSKAQAYQIYKLNRKVENLRVSTKPELLEWNTNDSNSADHKYLTLTSSNPLGDNYWQGTRWFINDPNTFYEQIENKSARLSKCIIWGMLRRINNTDLGNLYTKQVDTFKFSCYVRLCVYYIPEAKLNAPGASSFFDETSEYESGFKAPLLQGCATHGKILRVKRYKITNANVNEVPIKFSINLWKFNRFKPSYQKTDTKFNTNGELIYPRGTIVVVADILQQPPENVDAGNLDPQFDCQLRGKLLYYDA